MSSALMHSQAGNGPDEPYPDNSVWVRLLSASQADQIYSILLDQILSLGFPNAAVLELDDHKPKVIDSRNYSDSELAALSHKLEESWGKGGSVLSSWPSGNTTTDRSKDRSPLIHAMLFQSDTACRESVANGALCLAFANSQTGGPPRTEEQVCKLCGVRGYLSFVVTASGNDQSVHRTRELRDLVDVANLCLSRLLKLDQQYRRAEEAESGNTRLRAVMEGISDAVILTDADHRIVIKNRAADRFFRAPDRLGAAHAAAESNQEAFRSALTNARSAGTPAAVDLTLIDLQNAEPVRLVALFGRPEVDSKDRGATVVVLRDVTALGGGDEKMQASLDKHRATEEVLRLDRDRLSLVIENVGDPIVVADNRAQIVLLDSLARELFEGSEAPVSAQTEENRSLLKDYLANFTSSFADKESRPLHLFDPASKALVEYNARSGKVYDGSGQVAFTVTVLRDFSTWKKLEQLQDERRMLEMEKFAATGRLAGTIAHEINNPMEAVKNAIYLLKNKLDEQSQPIYEILKGETDRVARIVRQMLGLYRNTGELGDFDVNGIIDDTLTLFGRPLEKAAIIVERQLGELPQLRGSADQFRQLMSNLVVNSRDSMPSGGRLMLRTRYISSDFGGRGQISICIADTGTGIPRELQDSVFDPFLSTKGDKGTGLGLWIAKGIVQHHSGHIAMRSRPGKGTVFRLSFPLREA